MSDHIKQNVETSLAQVERLNTLGVSETGLSEGHAPQLIRVTVIDQAQLASLREIQQPGAADFVTELIDLFISEATLQIQALREAVRSEDAAEIQRLAHRLRGGSANMGATQMAALAEGLDCKNPAKDASEILAQLENEFALVSEALNAERKESDPHSPRH